MSVRIAQLVEQLNLIVGSRVQVPAWPHVWCLTGQKGMFKMLTKHYTVKSGMFTQTYCFEVCLVLNLRIIMVYKRTI